MPLGRIQRQLERLYEVEVPLDVEDFLTTDPEIARELDPDDDAPPATEKLFVRRDEDGIGVTLYVDREVVERLADDDPTENLHDGNIADYCTVLEGVSHFLYFTWNAGYERGVSLLELEMQAEIDKYVSSAILFGHQGNGRVPGGLHPWLFDEPEFDAGLDAAGVERYRRANYYAAKFCARLQSRYLGERPRAGMINELRRFYRLTARAKIDCVEQV